MPHINTCFYSVLASCLLAFTAVFPAFAEPELDTANPRPAPVTSYKDEFGNFIRLDPKASKLTIIHFWATWCVPCIAELPEVDAAQAAHAKKDVRIVTISLDGDSNLEKVKTFLHDNKIKHLKPYLDSDMMSYRASKARGLPTSLFIDQNGTEIARAEGTIDWNSGEVLRFIEKHSK